MEDKTKLTWKEFKDLVESAGIKDDDVMNYIDVDQTCTKLDIQKGEFGFYVYG